MRDVTAASSEARPEAREIEHIVEVDQPSRRARTDGRAPVQQLAGAEQRECCGGRISGGRLDPALNLFAPSVADPGPDQRALTGGLAGLVDRRPPAGRPPSEAEEVPIGEP